MGTGARLPVGQMDCAGAAEGRHLNVLMWARKHGYPWNAWTCAGDDEGRHLEVMMWAPGSTAARRKVGLINIPFRKSSR